MGAHGSTTDPVIDFVLPSMVKQGEDQVDFQVFGRNFSGQCLIFVENKALATQFTVGGPLTTKLDRSDTAATGKKRVFVHAMDTGAMSNDAFFEVVSDPHGVVARWPKR